MSLEQYCQSFVALTIVELRYLEHLLTKLLRLADEDGNMDAVAPDPLLLWLEELT